MKNIIFLYLCLSLWSLNGCSKDVVESLEPESGQSKPVHEKNTQQMYEFNPIKLIDGIEVDFTSTSVDGYGVSKDIIYHEEFEPIPTSVFDPITEINIGEEFEVEPGLSVVYHGYKIVDDSDGSGRKGIMFIHSRKNITDNVIGLGREGEPIATVFYAKYNNFFLLDHELSEKRAQDNYYYLERKVSYPMDNMKLCSEYIEVEPGETNLCYNIVSYAGPGEYNGYSLIYEDNSTGGHKINGSRLIRVNIP